MIPFLSHCCFLHHVLLAVTEKVWESESTDDSEPETRSHDLGKVGGARDSGSGAKESPVRVKPEQCSPSKGTKQASLMSFFRK